MWTEDGGSRNSENFTVAKRMGGSKTGRSAANLFGNSLSEGNIIFMFYSTGGIIRNALFINYPAAGQRKE